MGIILQKTLKGMNAGQLSRATTAGRMWAEMEGVEEGPEFLRIRALETRDWEQDPDLAEIVALMNERFLRPGKPGTLLPWQAVALAEASLYGRLYTVASVGAGKTLLSMLLPLALGAKRPLLLTFANLVPKTIREFHELSSTWHASQNQKVLSYEKLSIEKYKNFLTQFQPDVIVCDESHALKARDVGRTKRLDKYLEAHPSTVFVPLTGTPGDDTLNAFSHILAWSLREHSPLPRGGFEQLQWSQALDEKVTLRRAVGALRQFATSDELDDVRAGVGRRIETTPGVTYYRKSSVNCSLYIDAVQNTAKCPDMDAIFAHVRKHGDELPDGRVLETPIERHLTFQTLNLGFYRFIDPPPPAEWRGARKDYTAFVNDVLDQKNSPFETEGEVKRACELGQIDSYGTWETWRDIQPTFVPHHKVEWFSTLALDTIKEYMQAHKCLVWTSFPAFGRALAKHTGKPFYHHKGVALGVGMIEDHPKEESVILSSQANAFGRNLQLWSHMLLSDCPTKADKLEQMIGRCHRQGQQADAVKVTVYYGSVENAECLERARSRAQFDRDMGRNQGSKLLLNDWCVPELASVSAHGGPRWRK